MCCKHQTVLGKVKKGEMTPLQGGEVHGQYPRAWGAPSWGTGWTRLLLKNSPLFFPPRFGGTIESWRPEMVPVSQDNLQSAWR